MGNLPLPEQGDAWIDSSAMALKYYVGSQSRTVVPQDWFIAGEALGTIGIAVSLSTDGKVYETDTASMTRVLGLTLNTCSINGAVEVQRQGLFTFGSAVFGAGDVGKLAYIAAADGTLTTDKNAASAGNAAVIIVGQVLSTTTLVISVMSDIVGPINYSEVEYLAGESMNLSGVLPLVAIKADGKAYLASKQTDQNLYNVVGFAVSGENGTTVVLNNRIIVRHQGVVSGFTGLTMGSPVYASGTTTNLGTLTQNVTTINSYYDKVINVGYAISASAVLANIVPYYSFTDVSPIGSISVADNVTPDSGCLMMDGSVYNAVTNTQYQPLYDVVGNRWGGTNNTNFVLGNLNGGAIKYQIKYKYYYETNPAYTPVYRVEYPSSSTWETYANSDKTITVSSFGVLTPDSLRDFLVKVYAKKSSQVVEIAGLFTSGASIYGYTLEYLSSTQIRINLAPNGLAFMNSSNAIEVLDGTWTIKVIVYKDERFNISRDINADAKLNHLFEKSAPIFDEIGETDSLASYWSFDTLESNTTYLDHTTNAVVLTPTATSVVAGVNGNCVSLNGSSSLLVGTYTNGTEFSLCTWAYITATTGNDQELVCLHRSLYSPRMSIRVTNGLLPRLAWIATGDVTENLVSGTAIPLATWFHIVGTYNGTLGTLYVNGVLQGSTTATLTTTFNSRLSLGAKNTSPTISYLNGRLDETRVYTKALTYAEVIQLYQMDTIYSI